MQHARALLLVSLNVFNIAFDSEFYHYMINQKLPIEITSRFLYNTCQLMNFCCLSMWISVRCPLSLNLEGNKQPVSSVAKQKHKSCYNRSNKWEKVWPLQCSTITTGYLCHTFWMRRPPPRVSISLLTEDICEATLKHICTYTHMVYREPSHLYRDALTQ